LRDCIQLASDLQRRNLQRALQSALHLANRLAAEAAPQKPIAA